MLPPRTQLEADISRKPLSDSLGFLGTCYFCLMGIHSFILMAIVFQFPFGGTISIPNSIWASTGGPGSVDWYLTQSNLLNIFCPLRKVTGSVMDMWLGQTKETQWYSRLFGYANPFVDFSFISYSKVPNKYIKKHFWTLSTSLTFRPYMVSSSSMA